MVVLDGGSLTIECLAAVAEGWDEVALAPLPGGCGIAEVDRHTGGHAEAGVFGHLFALVPSDGTSQLLRQDGDRVGQGVSHEETTCACGRAGGGVAVTVSTTGRVVASGPWMSSVAWAVPTVALLGSRWVVMNRTLWPPRVASTAAQPPVRVIGP